MKERFSILRQLLSEAPSEDGWRDIWDWLQRWERVGEEAELAREYANRHLESWDDELRVIATEEPWKFVKDQKNLAWLPLARSLEFRGFPHSHLFESLTTDPQWRGIRRLTLAPSMAVEKKVSLLRGWDNLRLESLTLESNHWSIEMVEDILSTESCRELKELRCLFPLDSRIPFVRLLRSRAFEQKTPLESLALTVEFSDEYTIQTILLALNDNLLKKLSISFSGDSSQGWRTFAESALAHNLQSLTLSRRFVPENSLEFPEDVSFAGFGKLRELRLDNMAGWFVLRVIQTVLRESLESLHLLGWRHSNVVFAAFLEGAVFSRLQKLTLDGTASLAMLLRLLESDHFPVVEELTLHLHESQWVHLEKLVASIRWPALKRLKVLGRGTWETSDEESQELLKHWNVAKTQERSHSSPTRLQRLDIELPMWIEHRLRKPPFALKALLESGPCTSLSELVLRRVGLDLEALETLLSLEVCQHLTRLDVGHNRLQDEGIAMLAEYSNFEELRSLTIVENGMTSVGEAALLESGLLRQLWFLRD